MKFVVCVKLTPDTEQLAAVKPETVGKGDLGVTMVLNPWDEYAVEEALQLAERYDGDTIALTMGGAESVEALKRAVAMGIGETVFLCDDAFTDSDAWGTSYVLAAAIKKQGDPTLVLTGKMSVDGNSGAVGPGLAAQLGFPYISNVVKIEEVTATSATVRRMLDEGMQTVKVALPAVLSVSIEINEPRYPNFMGIRKASRLQYPAVTADDLGIDKSKVGKAGAHVRWTNLRKPPARGGSCDFVAGDTTADKARTLADKLIADKVL
ncbi:MAG TPA: electron transfer flavoprotein subunit beta/FixA family protein [Anaerolineae bacterium]